ncbi:MAG TPA: prephenate dehydratase [Egibacteraceae bacterium]|nr:prephenate dehydratase [Egibacteraceae bacterium]
MTGVEGVEHGDGDADRRDGAVAFLGPEGTFTSEAARRAAPQAPRQPLPTIDAVIDAVRSGDADLGVVPIENSIEGSVNLTLDALAFGPPGVFIAAEITIPISICLLGQPGARLADISVVRSQPHALAQCRNWLAGNLAQAAFEATTSTAEAARRAGEGDATAAALGTELAAQRYGLEVLASDIQDYAGNQTRFAVLRRRLAAPTGADKTSLVVFFGEDRPGLLLRILDEFALRGINLTKIESRPTKQQLGEYCIFIDCAGHPVEARVGEAMRSVHRHVAELRVLGAYPRADGLREGPAAADSDGAYAGAGDWYEALLKQVDPG